MAQFDLHSILQNFAATIKGVQEDKVATKETQSEDQELRQAATDASKIVADLANQQFAIDASQDLQLQERNRIAGQLFGTDLTDPAAQTAVLARARQAEIEKFMGESAYAESLLNVDPLASPLQYFLQRPFVQRNLDAAATAAGKAEQMGKFIQTLQNDTRNAVETNKAINTQFTAKEAEIAGAIKKLEGEGLIRAAKLVQNKEMLSDMEQLRRMSAEELKLGVDAYNLQATADQRALVNEQRRAMREAKVAEKLGATELMALYNVGAAKLGIKQYENADQFAALLKTPNTALKNQLAAVIDYAQPYAVNPNAPTSYGSSVGEVVSVLDSTGASTLNAPAPVRKFLEGAKVQAVEDLKQQAAAGKKITQADLLNQINSSTLDQPVLDKDGKPVKGKVSKSVVSRMQENTEVDQGVYGNLYRAPDIQILAQNVPALAQHPLFSTLVKNAASDKPADMWATAKLVGAEKKLAPELVADFFKLYAKSAAKFNNGVNQYSKYGLPPQRSVVTQLGEGKPVIDLEDAARVQRLYIQETRPISKDLSPMSGIVDYFTGVNN